MGDPWTIFGVLKTPGIPAPKGQYSVGCVDVMTKDNLLVRLYYPTRVQDGHKYQYTCTIPHPSYTRAILKIFEVQPLQLTSSLVNYLTGQIIRY